MSDTYKILCDIDRYHDHSERTRAIGLGISHPWLQTVIGYLEERGQISREKGMTQNDPDILRLTAKGKKALKALDTLHRLILRR